MIARLGDPRFQQLWLVGLLFLGLAFAIVVLEWLLGFEPCPLCIIDRWLWLAIALSGVAYLIFAGLWPLLVQGAGFVAAIGVAGYHVYLEANPSSASCLPGEGILGETLDLATQSFAATQDCSVPAFRLLGVSLAGFTLAAICLLFLVYLNLLRLEFRKNRRGRTRS